MMLCICSRLVLCLLVAATLLPGAECVYLKSGFTLDIESHTQNGGVYVLQGATGTVELPVTEVTRIDTVAASAPSPSNSPVETVSPEQLVRNAAQQQGLDADFVRSVAKIESGLQQRAVSPKGALGLMQLMPSTARTLGVDANKASENADGGAKYLRQLLLQYHGDSALALAAYNAGPGAVAKFKGVPPYSETRAYVLRVLREYQSEIKAKSAEKLARAAVSTNKPTAID